MSENTPAPGVGTWPVPTKQSEQRTAEADGSGRAAACRPRIVERLREIQSELDDLADEIWESHNGTACVRVEVARDRLSDAIVALERVEPQHEPTQPAEGVSW